MTSPPPPPPRDPDLPDPATDPTLVDATLVDPAGRRVVVDEEAGPVVRPYPWWLWVVAGLCLAAAIVFLVLWLMERDDGKDVPKVVGLQLAQAQDRAAADGFTLKTVRTPASQPAGIVVDQAPQPGADLEKGAQVMAVVSAGQEQVTVPHVIGAQSTAAEKLLTDIGLQASNESVQSPRPKGLVARAGPGGRDESPQGLDRHASRLERHGPGQGSGGRGPEPERRRGGGRARRPLARRDPGPVAGGEGHGPRAGSAAERAGASGLEGAHERLRRAGEHLHADPDGHVLGDHHDDRDRDDGDHDDAVVWSRTRARP